MRNITLFNIDAWYRMILSYQIKSLFVLSERPAAALS